MLISIPDTANFVDRYSVECYPQDADKAFYDGQEFARCWATGKWEMITPSNPLIDAIVYCGDRFLIRYCNSTIGNAVRLAERWNSDPDTHPKQIITHLMIDGQQHMISDRQFSLFQKILNILFSASANVTPYIS